jgi:sulfite oxidase
MIRVFELSNTTLSQLSAQTFGSPWNTGAISTAKWSGARLSDVLLSLGITEQLAAYEGMEHIQFVGMEDMEASIPAAKGMAL